MATIGSLAVNIVARTDKFVKGINKSRASVSTFSKTAQKATGMVKGFIGAFAAGVGIVGITRALTDAADRMDKLAKTSDKLGIASERLAGLQHAANQTGVSTETLNMALQRMVRRVAEAAQGTGEAVKALQELNLDAKELNGLSPDQVFSRIADQMAKVENQGDKVRLAMKLFDSEGVALVNTLASGAGGLEAFQREADKLGIAISRDKLKQVEEFNDALDNLGKAFQGVASKILIDIAPAALEAMETLSEFVDFLKGRSTGPRPTNAGRNTAFTSAALDPGWSTRTAKRLREERPYEVPIRDAMQRAREVQAQAPEQVTKLFGKIGEGLAKAGNDGASLFSRGMGAIGDSYDRGAPGRRRSEQERAEKRAEAEEQAAASQARVDALEAQLSQAQSGGVNSRGTNEALRMGSRGVEQALVEDKERRRMAKLQEEQTSHLAAIRMALEAEKANLNKLETFAAEGV